MGYFQVDNGQVKIFLIRIYYERSQRRLNDVLVQSLKVKILRNFNKNTLKVFYAFLDSLVCVLASRKKFTKKFPGESTEKAIYKMAAIIKYKIL